MELLFVKLKQNHVCSDSVEGEKNGVLYEKELWRTCVVTIYVGCISVTPHTKMNQTLLVLSFHSPVLFKIIQNYKAVVDGRWFSFQ